MPKRGRQRSARRMAGWLAALLALAGLAWLWWRAGQMQPPAAQASKVARPLTSPPPTPVKSATNRPPQISPRVFPPVLTATQSGPAMAIAKAPQERATSIGAQPPLPAPTNTPPGGAAKLTGFPRPVESVFEAQLALDRSGFSPGSIDGWMGSQTRGALQAYQRAQELPETGELDTATRESLLLTTQPLSTYTVTSNDLARLQPLSPTWLGKSGQSALDYETILELVAEVSHSSPALVRQLNPGVDWTNVAAGATVLLPNASDSEVPGKAGLVVIRLAERCLEVFGSETNLVAHFPCSIARRVEKRPVGELHVAVLAPDPDYTFDPAVFPESEEARQLHSKLILRPGPNNPVGVAWIGLDKPGYGIHGTPSPEQVGRTESHGCFRLSNWNAQRLLRMVSVGTPVYVEP